MSVNSWTGRLSHEEVRSPALRRCSDPAAECRHGSDPAARYLQKPRSDNFGDYLFRDVRARRAGSTRCRSCWIRRLIARKDSGRTAQFRLRVVARTCGVGALRSRHPRRYRALVRRYLLLERLEERAAADRAARRHGRGFAGCDLACPGSQMKVDLVAQIVVAPDGTTMNSPSIPSQNTACSTVSTRSTTR